MQKTRKLALITGVYWFLLIYIVAALLWWFISLWKQNDVMTSIRVSEVKKDDFLYERKLAEIRSIQKRKTIQYVGEGITFLVVIMVGAVFVYRATRREIKLSRQEQNFMMAITHELKTPIAVTQLNLETLQKRKLDAETIGKLIINTLREVNRLNELCNNVLYSAQLESGSKIQLYEQVNISRLVNDVINSFHSRYPSVMVNNNVQPGIVIKADELALQIMVSNLLENAVKYAGKDNPIIVELKTQNGGINLQVKDEGPGITDAEKHRVFEKFYRIGNENTRTAKGTGLGLYLCKRIAEQHHGKITVQDNNPRGTIIKVTLR